MQKALPVALVAAAAAVVLFFSLRESAPAFADYPAGEARKAVFLDYFAPLVAAQNAEILEQREQILEWRDNGVTGWWQSRALAAIAGNYYMEDFDTSADEDWSELLRRVDAVPVSLALAQAATESGWGTSRFATDANNYFGELCFEAGCGLVPENRGSGATYEIASFASPAASVENYLRNLNRHRAYAALRDIRARARAAGERVTGIALAAGLENYSTRGRKYVEELRAMIRVNSLHTYNEAVPL